MIKSTSIYNQIDFNINIHKKNVSIQEEMHEI